MGGPVAFLKANWTKLPRLGKLVAVLVSLAFYYGIFGALYESVRPSRYVEAQLIASTPLLMGGMLRLGRDIVERVVGAFAVLTLSASGMLCYWLPSATWQFVVMFFALTASIWIPLAVWMHRRSTSARSVPAELSH